MLNWFAGIWMFILDNPPLGWGLLIIFGWWVILAWLFFWTPKILRPLLNPEPDVSEAVAEGVKKIEYAKLHEWQKKRGI